MLDWRAEGATKAANCGIQLRRPVSGRYLDGLSDCFGAGRAHRRFVFGGVRCRGVPYFPPVFSTRSVEVPFINRSSWNSVDMLTSFCEYKMPEHRDDIPKGVCPLWAGMASSKMWEQVERSQWRVESQVTKDRRHDTTADFSSTTLNDLLAWTHHRFSQKTSRINNLLGHQHWSGYPL